jgi:hypothetical protein
MTEILVKVNGDKAREMLSQMEGISTEQLREMLMSQTEGMAFSFPVSIEEMSREDLLDIIAGLVSIACGEIVMEGEQR